MGGKSNNKHNGQARGKKKRKAKRRAVFMLMRETYVYIPESKGAARAFEKEMADKGFKCKPPGAK